MNFLFFYFGEKKRGGHFFFTFPAAIFLFFFARLGNRGMLSDRTEFYWVVSGTRVPVFFFCFFFGLRTFLEVLLKFGKTR